MSRIDEALQLTVGREKANPPTADGQRVFAPAWTVNEGESIGAAAAADASSRTDAMFPRTDRKPSGLIRFSSEWRARLAGGSEGDPALIEQFRRLAAVLHHAHQNNGLRSVMITSASPGDGKTLTAVNLALVLAESYRYNVLLVDADLRRPSIPSVVDLADGSGLSEVLRASNEQKLALVPITSKLALLPAGQPIANSIEALTSPRMHQILDEAAARFDWVVLDAPPVGPTADARLLTQMVGGTLFVVHAGKTPYAEVRRAIDAIGREQILGVVLNGVDAEPQQGQYYGVSPDTGKT